MIRNSFTQEPVGILNLKIAQLERHLKLLEQQQMMSGPYPDYKAKLIQKKMWVQTQLEQLLRYQLAEQQHN